MIRLVWIGAQIDAKDEAFAFFNTVTDRFLEFDGEQVFADKTHFEIVMKDMADDIPPDVVEHYRRLTKGLF